MRRESGLARPTLDLVSPLPLPECVRRLRAEVDSMWTFFGKRPLVGRVDDHWLRVARRIRYRNSFQTWMSARLSAEGGGTRLRCRFGMHPLVTVFMAAWFGFVLMLGGPASVVVLVKLVAAPAPTAAGEWLLALIPVWMLAIGSAMVGIGRWLARGERRYLIEFLRQSVEAREP